ncbi:MAG: indolepyruvate oxidoreductase subunit beta [Ruminococcus sp.]|jgi:indolepyruvate ferredoxin oxidoreductase beta subunit|nr:indolepyruvate oxidoreductase subunit beta [Ruminococcus sp.]
MNKDIMICGVGGQGTVLASKIIAASAMDEGYTVHSAETIGMAQRGGPVTSHVRIGDDAFSPLIPIGGADLLIAFEPSEAVRNLKYLKKDGFVIVNSVPMKPTSLGSSEGYDGKAEIEFVKSKCRCLIVNSDELCAPFGSSKFFNVAVLGAASGSGELGIKKETICDEIVKIVPERFKEKNLAAFAAGYKLGEER